VGEIARALPCGNGPTQLPPRQSFAVPNGLIAATARVHNLTLVTRNVAGFADTGVDVVNPWAA
jgi:predicted nucleic acid-binding protein